MLYKLVHSFKIKWTKRQPFELFKIDILIAAFFLFSSIFFGPNSIILVLYICIHSSVSILSQWMFDRVISPFSLNLTPWSARSKNECIHCYHRWNETICSVCDKEKRKKNERNEILRSIEEYKLIELNQHPPDLYKSLKPHWE